MNKQPARPQSGHGAGPHPLWMRLLTVFCMALLGIASTVQVCHSHSDAFESRLSAPVHAGQQPAGQPDSPDANSAVRCPLCVAMHSALPVAQSLVQVATLQVEPAPPLTVSVTRLHLWRSDLASRPPPSASPLA